MIRFRSSAGTRCRSTPTELCAFVLILFASTTFASPIPPAHFTFDVIHGGSVVAGCTPLGGSSNGGTCGSESSGPGYAATSGGIGSPSYLPVTPGGTVLGPGTAVDALSSWVSGGRDISNATVTYSFEVTGPGNVDLIPIDVFSKGLLNIVGDATASLSLVITDSGPDDNIPPGVPDKDSLTPLLDLTAFCTQGLCSSDWGNSGAELLDQFCVTNGDNYEVTIDAATSAGPGFGSVNSASALLDPVIKVDPPFPTNCKPPVNVNALTLATGPGASPGYLVPEPSALDLAAIGVLALGVIGIGRRRARES